MNNKLYIPFDGKKLIAVEHDGQIYVAMRPIVEGIGLEWARQAEKLNHTKFSCVHMYTTGVDGKKYQMLCIPLKKLNGWLFSVNPEKVKESIRNTLIAYQEECFVVLYDYWHQGEAIRAKVQTELNEWRKREKESFGKSSKAGKDLNSRKKEKHFLELKIQECELNLIQPNLFD